MTTRALSKSLASFGKTGSPRRAQSKENYVSRLLDDEWKWVYLPQKGMRKSLAALRYLSRPSSAVNCCDTKSMACFRIALGLVSDEVVVSVEFSNLK